MIKKTEIGFSIEIGTGDQRADTYLGIVNDLINLLQRPDDVQADTETNYYALELLRAMLPDYEAVTAMFGTPE